MTRISLRLLLLLAIAGTIGCDRVTKHVAAVTLSEGPSRSYLADTFRLEYTENTGAFLSLGSDWPPAVRTGVFGVGNAVLLALFGLWAIRAGWSRLTLLGVTLFIAGGFSNLVDRIAYGSVVDFLNVGVGSVRTGVFNVADMAILLGAAIFLLESYRSDRQEASESVT